MTKCQDDVYYGDKIPLHVLVLELTEEQVS